MSKIGRVSHRFSLLFKALLVIYPLLVISMWLGLITPPQGYFMPTRLPFYEELSTIRLPLRLLAGLVDMFPTVVVMMSFYYLVKLFQLYAKDIIFSYQNVVYIRKIGFTLLWQVFAMLLVQPFISLILTWDAPKGGHTIALGIGSDEIANLVIGGIVVLISWVMEEGRKLEEETALTV